MRRTRPIPSTSRYFIYATDISDSVADGAFCARYRAVDARRDLVPLDGNGSVVDLLRFAHSTIFDLAADKPSRHARSRCFPRRPAGFRWAPDVPPARTKGARIRACDLCVTRFTVRLMQVGFGTAQIYATLAGVTEKTGYLECCQA